MIHQILNVIFRNKADKMTYYNRINHKKPFKKKIKGNILISMRNCSKIHKS